MIIECLVGIVGQPGISGDVYSLEALEKIRDKEPNRFELRGNKLFERVEKFRDGDILKDNYYISMGVD